MPIIQPDTSAQLDMSAIDEGVYPAKITKVEYGVSKNSGNPMITPYFDVEVTGKIKPRKTYLVITGEGSYGFDQLLRACGFSDIADAYKDPNITEKPAFDTDELVGMEVNVVIGHEIYNNETRDKIKSFLPR